MSLYLVVNHRHFYCCLELFSDGAGSMLSSCEARAPWGPQVQALPPLTRQRL